MRLGPVETDSTIRDITERRQRERRLRSFREAVEQAGHVIMITDTDGTIEYVNPAFETVTGYRAEEAIGERPEILSSGAHDEELYEVRDTGPRIPEMERALFGDGEKQTPLYLGTGLGLWYVTLITSRAGGTITYGENSPAGNVVGIELPR